MKLGFDNDKYLRIQSEHIKERIAQFGDKLYLEFGGKLYDDYHASRVLPGFHPDSKLRMLMQLKDDAEIIISPYDLQRLLSRLFAASTHIQSFRPDTLRFAYNRGRSRTLPVRLSGSVRASRQNYIQSVSVEPDSVHVFAPATVLDTMNAVYTEPFVLDELSEPTRRQMMLRKQKLIKYDPAKVDIIVGVGYYTEKTIQAPVIGLNFPAEKRLRTFPAQVAVTFRVESGRYHQISAEDFVLATTYEDLLLNPENSKLPLHLKSTPEGVSDVRISPSEVDYLIEQVDTPF